MTNNHLILKHAQTQARPNTQQGGVGVHGVSCLTSKKFSRGMNANDDAAGSIPEAFPMPNLSSGKKAQRRLGKKVRRLQRVMQRYQTLAADSAALNTLIADSPSSIQASLSAAASSQTATSPLAPVSTPSDSLTTSKDDDSTREWEIDGLLNSESQERPRRIPC